MKIYSLFKMPFPGMTNQCLKDQGLVSVKELWVKIDYPPMAR
ncbi:MAG TPA: hypothetical protein PKV75_02740 [Desulfobacterales bacterium]|nr:hypothetical protein [Desulfobacterales bacterium]